LTHSDTGCAGGPVAGLSGRRWWSRAELQELGLVVVDVGDRRW
jgi:hypothetical protein